MWLEKADRLIWIIIALSVLAVIGMRINNNSPKPVQVISSEPKEYIKVSVTGEVQNCGEYMVEHGTRVCDVLYHAGGITEKADVELVELDARIVEHTRIDVPSIDDDEQRAVIPIIDINKADFEELVVIPCIGEYLAQKIVDYRKNAGEFSCVEDIMNVQGIGQKTFNKIKGFIKVE